MVDGLGLRESASQGAGLVADIDDAVDQALQNLMQGAKDLAECGDDIRRFGRVDRRAHVLLGPILQLNGRLRELAREVASAMDDMKCGTARDAPNGN